MLKDSVKYDKFLNWSFNKWQQWPRKCKSNKMDSRFKSPVIIPEELFQEESRQKKAKGEKEEEAEENIKVNWDSLIVRDDIKPFWMDETELKNKQEELKDYYKHPTYSFRGLQENFILGHLGELSL